MVKYISHRLAVMYLGKVVELSETKELFRHPRHPYSHALLSGIPIPDVEGKSERIVLEGDVPSPLNPPRGCRFHTRCPFVIQRCESDEPQLTDIGGGHQVACHRQADVEKLVFDRFGK